MSTALCQVRRSILTAALLAAPAIAADAPATKPGELLKPASPAAKVEYVQPIVVPTPVKWTTTKLSDVFYCEGAAVGDFNHDGKPDLVAGPYWYEGPDFSPEEKHAIYEPKPCDPLKYSENFVAFAHDFNGDGYDDVLVYGHPGKEAFIYENPGKSAEAGMWKRHVALASADNESPTFADVDGDGTPDIVCTTGGFMGYATMDKADPFKPWTFHAVSPKGPWQRYTHGLGVGDVNGDGKMDLLEKDGWWEQPKEPAADGLWKKHDFKFGGGQGGAQMHVYDVNGDGRNDVITSIAAHGFGLAWYEQTADGSFTPHIVMNATPGENPQKLKISQLHAIDLVDIDGDGLKDIVTGKRYWAHGPTGDIEPAAPAVLYWFQLVRKDGQASYVGHQIDDNSGVGTQVMAVDLNGDKKPDVVVGNKKGTFVHIQSNEGQPAAQAK